MVKKINITFDADSVSSVDACLYVQHVIRDGYVSESKNIPHYCFLTTWSNGIRVYVRNKKTVNSADSFHVYKQ